MEKRRVEWIDTAKFLGIFAIYLGHYDPYAGLWKDFVFSYHVPLFFFISGCMDTYDRYSIRTYLYKKCKSILFPFWGFAILSIIIAVIVKDMSFTGIKLCLVALGYGCIRGTFFAESLWFLSALFVMEIVFKMIKQSGKKWIMLVISAALFIFSSYFVSEASGMELKHFYNWDWALFYLIYFAIGYCVYPSLCKWLLLDSKEKKISFLIVFLITAFIAALVFEKKTYISDHLADYSQLNELFIVIRTLVLILFNLLLARALSGVRCLSNAGRETLFLCGNEYVVKTIAPGVLSLLGISLHYKNPLSVFICVAALISINIKWIIPFEKEAVRSIKACFFSGEDSAAL